MMRVVIVGLIICQVIVASRQKGAPTREKNEILEASESRYPSSRDYPQRDYNHGPRRNHYEPPIHFNAPPFETQDHWRQNRRTFFPEFPYDSHSTTTPFPTFYQLMTSLFGGRDDIPVEPSDKFRYDRHRPTPPYPFETPYSFRPTEPNYIPPPKPIRASVIKLESITRSPIYSSFDGEITTKYYHNAGSLLNHVLIENSKAQHHLGFHPQESPPEVEIPPFKPLPVLPKPKYLLPTITPTNPTQAFHRYNETGYKYPDSVQDQLPHLNLADAKIPYVSEKTIPQIFDTLPTETSPGREFQFTRESFPPQEPSATTNVLGLIDIRSLNSSGGTLERRLKPSGGVRLEFDVTTVKSFPGAVEKVKRPTFKFTKKLSTHPDKSSVERITNLTVQGLSTLGKENVSKQVNYLNVRDLIRYEMNRLGNSSGSTQLPDADNSSKRLVNLNDELSLDAKILKDTNWDGLTVLPTAVTTEVPEDASTLDGKSNTQKTAFWEIVEGESTTLSTTEISKLTTVTTERGRPETTTEPWSATRDSTDTNEPSTSTQETTTLKASVLALRRSEKLLSQRPVTEEVDTLAATTERIPKRRYSRRPKIVSFTPYPTTEELQKRMMNRNHFAKRQKPNITLAFGNKNVLKSRQSFGKEEVMNFSDEEVRKRRKIGKRRQLYKRTRASTSEPTVQEHLL